MLHAHLLTPVSEEMTKRLAHVGQNNIGVEASGAILVTEMEKDVIRFHILSLLSMVTAH